MAYNLLLLPIKVYVVVNDNLIGQYLSASLVSYVVVLLFRRFEKIKQNNFSMPLFWAYALVISISVEATMYFSTTTQRWLVDIFAVILFLGVLLLIFYVYDSFSAAYEEKLKAALYSQEKEYYLAQCRLMQESVNKMKAFRHDTKNHLAILKEYSAGNKMATEYLDSLLGDIGVSEVYSDTGNIAFDSIINYKLKNAAEDNIKLDMRLFVPKVLGIEVVDIITILGNLLDNAVDAVMKVEDRMINLNVEFNKSNLFIMINNTYDGIIEYADDGRAEYTDVSRTMYADDSRTEYANDRRTEYMQDRRAGYALDRRAGYAQDRRAGYVQDRRAKYVKDRRDEYMQDRRAEYVQDRIAEYVQDRRAKNTQDRRDEYTQDRRTKFMQDRRAEYVQDRIAEYTQGRRAEYTQDRRADYAQDRRAEYIQDRRAEYIQDRRANYTKDRSGEEKHLASRKSGDDHGHGLKNIKMSVEKYNGHLVITYDESIFSVGILLYVDET
jgi:hypothetical protein